MGTTDPLPARVRELVAENEQLRTEIKTLTERVDTVAPPEEGP